MIVVGIIGSPAGGKSTVAEYLQGLGATWINADRIAREVLEQADVQRQLIDHFGPDIADNQGRVERSKLAARVFGDDDSKRAALRCLERVIHPRTRQLITDRLRETQRQSIAGRCLGIAVLDVPLLLEVGWDRVCDEIWCVDSNPSQRLVRAQSRGWDQSQLRLREANQIPISEKRRLSTVVIDNNGTLEQLYETIFPLWSSLKRNTGKLVDDRHCLDSP